MVIRNFCDVTDRMLYLLSSCPHRVQVAGSLITTSMTRCWRTDRKRISRRTNARRRGKNMSVRNSASTSARLTRLVWIFLIPPITRCSRSWCRGSQPVPRSLFAVWSRTCHCQARRLPQDRRLFDRRLFGLLRSPSLVNIRFRHFWLETSSD